MELLSKKIMLTALSSLEEILPCPVSLIVGGGGALLLSDQFPLATSDIDAVPKGMSAEELGDYVKTVAIKLKIAGDWLNPYFSTFTHVLPMDFERRLLVVYEGSKLVARALGKEDLLIMKCFAHRQKDIPHARALIRGGADVEFVSTHIESLRKRKTPGVVEALDFLDQMIELEEA